jgi:hypothetical protein
VMHDVHHLQHEERAEPVAERPKQRQRVPVVDERVPPVWPRDRSCA